MKSSLLALLAAATLSLAPIGAVHAQDATTPDATQSTACGETAGNMGAPESLMDNDSDDDSMNASSDDSTNDDSAGTCCIGKDGSPTVQGVDSDCPAKDEATGN
ncbi:MAG: hypothetical protein JWP26_562 [Devosia sp.]|nr:hypothetical protein [Devosia sp.]MDB5585592.1 hypothetical protein [Devosia sp.]